MTGKRKLLLTGGTGMCGRNILEHPGMADWDVLAPTRAELDLYDYDATLDYVQRNLPDVIVHTAGHVFGIQQNILHPVDFLVKNTDVGRNIVMAARSAGIRQLVNLATSCMYPREGNNPLHEEDVLTGELEPTNEGYAIAKVYTTRLCQYVRYEDPSFEYKSLIPCNLFGRYDKFLPGQSHMVPAAIYKMHHARLDGVKEVEIWGDGTARREFMYAGDLADAVVKAAADVAALPDLMNVGLGFDYTVSEYYEAVADVLGWDGTFVHNLDRPVGMRQKLVAVERQTAWGWAPSTSLRDGIAKAYDYFLSTGQ